MQATEVLEPVRRDGDPATDAGGTDGCSIQPSPVDVAVGVTADGAPADTLGRLLAEVERRRLVLEATVGALRAEREPRPAEVR
jgi:hypothetical protein